MKILCELKKCGNWIRIHEDGGMVTVEFDLGGKRVNPFYCTLAGIYRWRLLGFLKGDFVCVPFGNKSCSPIPGMLRKRRFLRRNIRMDTVQRQMGAAVGARAIRPRLLSVIRIRWSIAWSGKLLSWTVKGHID